VIGIGCSILEYRRAHLREMCIRDRRCTDDESYNSDAGQSECSLHLNG